MQQIEELLGADAPTLARLEEMLTEGYAQALTLEAERWRLERRLGELARGGDGDVGEELRSLGRRLASTDDELAGLRVLLGSLNDRTRLARAAS